MLDEGMVFEGSQPDPSGCGEPVRPALVRFLGSRIPGAFPLSERLLEEREAAGVRTYGTVLRTCNGRDPARDAVEELADLLMYMEQEHLEHGDGMFDNGDILEAALVLERCLRWMARKRVEVDRDA